MIKVEKGATRGEFNSPTESAPTLMHVNFCLLPLASCLLPLASCLLPLASCQCHCA
ncbi:MAG: hypothetical protein F6J90_28635 [Moorea sp. SIOASIH]|uniref:hypothetical protein n=1 Tax=Moorena sp. SIOASIH TaxID=2607817 RepID=UPI0013BD1FDC|nr:hypothetical protein [Moorena sp. SIOASIH]NEO40091.1 hypothetical protein [Moorena sp. SIOASIH]